eukprot:jgi/Mesvir1/22807/Mv14221-RA.1
MTFGRIVIQRDGRDSHALELDNLDGNALTFGRDASRDVRINKPIVSRLHCKLAIDDSGSVFLHNLSSVNPVLVCGKPVTNPVQLKDCDVIDICGSIFRYESQIDATIEINAKYLSAHTATLSHASAGSENVQPSAAKAKEDADHTSHSLRRSSRIRGGSDVLRPLVENHQTCPLPAISRALRTRNASSSSRQSLGAPADATSVAAAAVAFDRENKTDVIPPSVHFAASAAAGRSRRASTSLSTYSLRARNQSLTGECVPDASADAAAAPHGQHDAPTATLSVDTARMDVVDVLPRMASLSTLAAEQEAFPADAFDNHMTAAHPPQTSSLRVELSQSAAQTEETQVVTSKPASTTAAAMDGDGAAKMEASGGEGEENLSSPRAAPPVRSCLRLLPADIRHAISSHARALIGDLTADPTAEAPAHTAARDESAPERTAPAAAPQIPQAPPPPPPPPPSLQASLAKRVPPALHPDISQQVRAAAEQRQLRTRAGAAEVAAPAEEPVAEGAGPKPTRASARVASAAPAQKKASGASFMDELKERLRTRKEGVKAEGGAKTPSRVTPRKTPSKRRGRAVFPPSGEPSAAASFQSSLASAIARRRMSMLGEDACEADGAVGVADAEGKGRREAPFVAPSELAATSVPLASVTGVAMPQAAALEPAAALDVDGTLPSVDQVVVAPMDMLSQTHVVADSTAEELPHVVAEELPAQAANINSGFTCETDQGVPDTKASGTIPSSTPQEPAGLPTVTDDCVTADSSAVAGASEDKGADAAVDLGCYSPMPCTSVDAPSPGGDRDTQAGAAATCLFLSPVALRAAPLPAIAEEGTPAGTAAQSATPSIAVAVGPPVGTPATSTRKGTAVSFVDGPGEQEFQVSTPKSSGKMAWAEVPDASMLAAVDEPLTASRACARTPRRESSSKKSRVRKERAAQAQAYLASIHAEGAAVGEAMDEVAAANDVGLVADVGQLDAAEAGAGQVDNPLKLDFSNVALAPAATDEAAQEHLQPTATLEVTVPLGQGAEERLQGVPPGQEAGEDRRLSLSCSQVSHSQVSASYSHRTPRRMSTSKKGRLRAERVLAAAVHRRLAMERVETNRMTVTQEEVPPVPADVDADTRASKQQPNEGAVLVPPYVVPTPVSSTHPPLVTSAQDPVIPQAPMASSADAERARELEAKLAALEADHRQLLSRLEEAAQSASEAQARASRRCRRLEVQLGKAKDAAADMGRQLEAMGVRVGTLQGTVASLEASREAAVAAKEAALVREKALKRKIRQQRAATATAVSVTTTTTAVAEDMLEDGRQHKRARVSLQDAECQAVAVYSTASVGIMVEMPAVKDEELQVSVDTQEGACQTDGEPTTAVREAQTDEVAEVNPVILQVAVQVVAAASAAACAPEAGSPIASPAAVEKALEHCCVADASDCAATSCAVSPGESAEVATLAACNSASSDFSAFCEGLSQLPGCTQEAASTDGAHEARTPGAAATGSCADACGTTADAADASLATEVLPLVVAVGAGACEDEAEGCFVCHSARDEEEEVLLICDGCEQQYHLGCCVPPLRKVPPEEQWFCHYCRPSRSGEEASRHAAMEQGVKKAPSRGGRHKAEPPGGEDASTEPARPLRKSSRRKSVDAAVVLAGAATAKPAAATRPKKAKKEEAKKPASLSRPFMLSPIAECVEMVEDDTLEGEAVEEAVPFASTKTRSRRASSVIAAGMSPVEEKGRSRKRAVPHQAEEEVPEVSNAGRRSLRSRKA